MKSNRTCIEEVDRLVRDHMVSKAVRPGITECFPRPFICNGNPCECNVFIVGINPANTLKCPKCLQVIPWTAHWHPDNEGYDLRGFYQDYIGSRNPKPANPWLCSVSKRVDGVHGKISKTRAASECIASEIETRQVDGVGNLKVLETNIYWHPSTGADDLSVSYKSLDGGKAFLELVRLLQPLAVIFHGKDDAESFPDNHPAAFADTKVIKMSEWWANPESGGGRKKRPKSHLRHFPFKEDDGKWVEKLANSIANIANCIARERCL